MATNLSLVGPKYYKDTEYYLIFQLVTFFRGFGVAAPARSFMYSVQSNVLYKVVYAQYLKMQVMFVAKNKV